jgi:transaldolase/glucose-6-phosphate isomerase
VYDEQGQSPWIDNITRGMISSGELQDYIGKGIRGLTSNPSIFEKAISSGEEYEAAMRELVADGADATRIYEELIVADIQSAADVLRPLYESTSGGDGFVSIEVSPKLAYDTEGTIEEARKFWRLVDRPNLMVKVPATEQGIPAIRQLLTDGLNINITLIFSTDYHDRVMEAYLDALEARVAAGESVDRIASVASFFVSRVDTEVDKRLGALIEQEADEGRRKRVEDLLGKAAVANARIAYEHYQKTFSGERFARLVQAGAKVQRPLWGSTGTKNPAYSDVLYVDSLIGPDTVNTMPPATIEAFLDHGTVERTADRDLDAAHVVMQELEEFGISMKEVTDKLLEAGGQTFVDSFDGLDRVIHEKITTLQASVEERQTAQLDGLQAAVDQTLAQLQSDEFGARLWQRDPGLWKDDAATREKIADRLGWLPVIEEMQTQVPELQAFAEEIRGEGFTHAVVLGMGGSSLAPDVFRHTFGSKEGFPELRVLDTTDSASIRSVEQEVDLAKTLFIVSSKSGTTIEPASLMGYFWERVQAAGAGGANFVAITDPDTKLAREARDKGFRRVFENRADIGGRYSALSYFGLVPAALIGVDLVKMFDSVGAMARACGPESSAAENPGVYLGAVMAEAAKAGRDKLTLVLSPGIRTYGYWVEQLIAESTGKEGTGILPVEGETLAGPEVYGSDRLFVHLDMDAPEDVTSSELLDALAQAGHPVLRLKLTGPLDLGGEFLRWEIATAAAGAALGINPFDEPNVQESKDNTNRLLQQFRQQGSLPEGEPALTEGELALYGVEGGSASEALQRFFGQAGEGSYVAFMAYTQSNDEIGTAIHDSRMLVRDGLRVATTVGYGPRFLHSTGQLHKGGKQVGVYVQITTDDRVDVPIPGEDFSFNVLKRAQALGDFQALQGRGRPALRVHVSGDLVAGLLTLQQLVEDAVAVRS